MKADIDHLPQKQQDELALIRTTLLNAFETALTAGGGGTQPWRRNGKVLKIILFGSYARNDWVDEAENGYQSDFDLLIVVNHEKLTDIAAYWWVAEDQMLRDPYIGRPVNIIVHTLADVNQALSRGESFWSDIHRDGVMLYDLPGHPLNAPRPMTPQDAESMAQRYFDQWLPKVDDLLEVANFCLSNGKARLAAFNLHQAVETSYICFLLVSSFYSPRSHNIKFLRSLAEDGEKALAEVWPRENRVDRRRFELLKRAYVEARYSDQYDVSSDDLAEMVTAAQNLRNSVAAACETRLRALREAVG